MIEDLGFSISLPKSVTEAVNRGKELVRTGKEVVKAAREIQDDSSKPPQLVVDEIKKLAGRPEVQHDLRAL